MIVKNVRLRYADVFKAKKFDESDPDETAEFQCTFLIPGDHPQLEDIRQHIKTATVDKFGKKPVTLKHVCLRDAEEKADKDGFEPGAFFIKASNDRRPSVFDNDEEKTPLTAEDNRLYAGCWADVSVNFYAYDNKFGKGISASLRGLRLRRQDDAFGGRSASADEFEDIPEEDDDYKID